MKIKKRLAAFFLPVGKRENIIFYICFFSLFLFLSFGMINVEPDEDLNVLLPDIGQVHREQAQIANLSQVFPDEEYIVLGVTGDPFTLDNIKHLWQLVSDLENLTCTGSILSPFNTFYIKKIGKTFTIGTHKKEQYPETERERDRFMTRLTSTRFNVGTVISYDKKSAGIIIRKNIKTSNDKPGAGEDSLVKIRRFFFGYKPEERGLTNTEVVSRIEEVIRKYDERFVIYYSGLPVFEAKSIEVSNRDFSRLFIPAVLIVFLIFYLNLRSWKLVILPFVCIGMSLTMTLGLMGWLRIKISPIGAIIPPLIITIGSSYTLHFLNAYYLYSTLPVKPFLISRAALSHILPTITVASVTTIIGFSSFFITSINAVRQTALFVITSIFFTVLLTFFLLPRMLVLASRLHRSPLQRPIKRAAGDVFTAFLRRLAKLVYPLRFVWIGTYVMAVVLFILFIPRLKSETNTADLFEKDSHTYKSLVFFQENFGGIVYFNITIKPVHDKGFFKTQEGMLAAKKIQEYLDRNLKIKGMNTIGWNISAVSLLEDINRVLTGTPGIPDEPVITRFMSFLKIIVKNDTSFRILMNEDASMLNFQVRTNTDDVDMANTLTEEDFKVFEEVITKELTELAEADGRFTVNVWGDLFLISRITQYLLNDQIKSPLITIVFVLLLTLAMFRSVYYSVLSLIPLSFGVIMNFVIMSTTGIPLDTVTIMIASIAIGIGIDDSVHFILNFREESKKQPQKRLAVRRALYKTSRPIFFTSFALVGGFMVFAVSFFTPIKYFGILIALTMLNCTFATLFILPSILLLNTKKNDKNVV